VLQRIKLKIIAYRLCQIALNRKLSHKFKKWYKFSSRVKAESLKRNRVKRDLLVFTFSFTLSLSHTHCASIYQSISSD